MKSKITVYTQEGKKLGEGLMLNKRPKNPFSNYGTIPNKKEFNCEFNINLSEKNAEEIEAVQKLLFEDTERQMKEFYEKVGELTEHILRNYVTPPIKGEITKGKVRRRGLQIVWQKTDTVDAFVGIRQRDTLILPNGAKIPWDSLEKTDK